MRVNIGNMRHVLKEDLKNRQHKRAVMKEQDIINRWIDKIVDSYKDSLIDCENKKERKLAYKYHLAQFLQTKKILMETGRCKLHIINDDYFRNVYGEEFEEKKDQ